MAGAMGAGLAHGAVAKVFDVVVHLDALAGKMNGMAEDASRCSCVMRSRAALRCERTQGFTGSADSKR